MKNIKSILLTGLTLLAGASFVSCTEEEFQPGPEASGVQVFFPEATQTDYSLDDNMTSVTIPVKRANTEGEYTVSVLPDFSQNETDPTSLFTIPESVTFADGEDETSLVVSFKRADMEDGATYTVNLLLNDAENTTPYGYSQLSLTLTPWPWTLLGTGSYRDDWMSNFFSPNYVEIEVNIHEHKTNKGVYMVEEMLGWPFMTEFFEATQADLSGQFSYTPSNIVVDCSDPNNVVIEQQYSGITENTYGYGNFYIFSDAAGTLENGVITFPESGIIIACDGASEDAGAYYANGSGMFRILLPGAVITDYSLAAEYSGMRVASDNETASAVFDFTYGADVAGINYMFAPGDVSLNPSEYLNEMVAGTAENVYTVDDFVVGGEKVSIEAALTPGVYTIIAVPENAAGELVVDNASVVSFYFPGAGAGETPECDIELNLYHVSEARPELASEYPDYSSILYEIKGSELKSVRGFFAATSSIKNLLDQGATLQQLIDANASDITANVVSAIAEDGVYFNIYTNLNSSTSYTYVLEAENIYGNKAIAQAELSTTAIPYSGELVVGNYSMTCSIPQENAEPFVSESNVIVEPVAGSETEFVVYNLDGLKSGIGWNATYDSAAATLTLDGTSNSFGPSAEGSNMFGNWLGASSTIALAYISYTDEESASAGNLNSPLVFSVNEEKQLSGLKTYLEIDAGSLDGNQIKDAFVYQLFDPTTTLSYQPDENAKSTQSVYARPSSLELYPEMNFGVNKTSYKMKSPFIPFKEVISASQEIESGVRTLSVETRVCAPLPKDATHRFSVKANATHVQAPLK